MKLKKTVCTAPVRMHAAVPGRLRQTGSDDTTKPDGEPKNAQEAAAMYKDLMDQENAILMENQSLWEKVFLSADKGMTTQGGRQELR